MNRTLSFLFAAALGATLGAFTALELATTLGVGSALATTFGVIVGGLTGYITVDFRQFCAGVRAAARATFLFPVRRWQAYLESSRERKLSVRYSAIAFGLGMFQVVLLDHIFAPGFPVQNELFVFMKTVLPMSLLFFIGSVLITYASQDWRDEEKSPALSPRIIYWVSLIGIAHAVLLKALPWVVRNVWTGLWWLMKQIAAFFKHLFILVHSERRTLCCLDAMLGTLVGYYFGSWPAGAVAGLVFALISYELVSKRWLRLQTA